MRWFDLKDLGGKLERLRNGEGVFHLRLTLTEDAAANAEADDVLAAAGWQVAEPNVFDNYRRLDKLSDILDAIRPFFSQAEDLVRFARPQKSLQQGEQVQGFVSALVDDADKIQPELSEVAANLQGMVSSKREAIVARVAAAQKLAGIAGPQSKLFNNDGFHLWEKLAGHFGYREATSAMIAVLHLGEEKGELFEAAHEDLLDAAESGRALPKISSQSGLVPMMMIRLDNQANIVSQLKLRSEREAYLNFMRYLKAHYQTWDGARLSFQDRWEEPEAYGNRFLADPAMPQAWKTDTQHRTSSLIEKVAAIMEMEPRLLFGGASRIFHLGRSVGREALGYRRNKDYKVAGEVLNVAAVKTSPYHSGVLLHELAHEIDLSNAHPDLLGMSVKERSRILLEETGVRQQVAASVEMAEMDESYKAYLLSDVEIIARTFEVAITDRLAEMGEKGTAAAGGVYAAHGGSYFAPAPEPARQFLAALTEIVHLAKDKRIERELEAQEARRSSAAAP